MALNSTEIKEFPQADGTKHVHIYHVDDAGKWYRAERMRDVPAGETFDGARLRTAFNQTLIDAEGVRIAEYVEGGGDPALIVAEHVDDILPYVATGFMRAELANAVVSAIFFRDRVTNVALDASVGVPRRQEVRDRQNRVLSIETEIESDTRESL